MDNQSLFDELSKIISDAAENKPAPEGENTDAQRSILVDGLKAAAGQSGGAVENEVTEFLNGKGALLETTRTAVARGKSAVSDVAAFLTDKFNLSSPLALLIASLLVRLFPNLSKLTGEASSSKPKPPRKAGPKTSSSAKPAASSKPRKRKTTSSAKPSPSSKPKKRKTTSSAKPAAIGKPKKRKTTSATKPAASSKPKKRKTSSRAQEIPSSEDA